MWDAFQRFGGTQRAWADEINVAESQIGKYFQGYDLPRYEVMLRIAKLDRVPTREVEAYWRVADDRSSFKAQGVNSLDDSASLECRCETLVISRHASFAMDHPVYSHLVRQLVQSGSRYTVVLPEGEAARRIVFNFMMSCIDAVAGEPERIQSVVYTIEPARLHSILDNDEEVEEIVIYSDYEQHLRVGIQSGHVRGPGVDWLLDNRRTCAFGERTRDAIRRPIHVWNASALRKLLARGAKPRR